MPDLELEEAAVNSKQGVFYVRAVEPHDTPKKEDYFTLTLMQIIPTRETKPILEQIHASNSALEFVRELFEMEVADKEGCNEMRNFLSERYATLERRLRRQKRRMNRFLISGHFYSYVVRGGSYQVGTLLGKLPEGAVAAEDFFRRQKKR